VVEEGPGEALTPQDLGPGLEGQVGDHQNAGLFVRAADDFEEEFGAGPGKGDIAEFVKDDQIGPSSCWPNRSRESSSRISRSWVTRPVTAKNRTFRLCRQTEKPKAVAR